VEIALVVVFIGILALIPTVLLWRFWRYPGARMGLFPILGLGWGALSHCVYCLSQMPRSGDGYATNLFGFSIAIGLMYGLPLGMLLGLVAGITGVSRRRGNS